MHDSVQVEVHFWCELSPGPWPLVPSSKGYQQRWSAEPCVWQRLATVMYHRANYSLQSLGRRWKGKREIEEVCVCVCVERERERENLSVTCKCIHREQYTCTCTCTCSCPYQQAEQNHLHLPRCYQLSHLCMENRFIHMFMYSYTHTHTCLLYTSDAADE